MATIDVRGVRLTLHPPGEGVSDMIRASGDFYEASILDFLRDTLPPQRTIVDVGAFIGNHACYFAEFLEHDEVYAFEPLPANFSLLADNVWPYPTIYPHALALSDKHGTLRMTEVPDNMGASSVTEDGPIEVSAVTLDELGLRHVTLLKIDVENHEGEVLAGARRTIARDRPAIFIEDWTGGTRIPALGLAGYELVKTWEPCNFLYRWVA